jgi:hypothetical protein
VKKVLSILLATYFLLSSIGLNAAAHYCMGNIAHLGLGFSIEVEGCGMEADQDDCTTDSNTQIDPYNCCSDHHQQLLVENDFSSTGHYDLKLPIGISLLPSDFFSIEVAPNNRFDFLIPPCNPPPRLISYRVLYCSYLI